MNTRRRAPLHPFTLVAIMLVVLVVGIVILANVFGWKAS